MASAAEKKRRTKIRSIARAQEQRLAPTGAGVHPASAPPQPPPAPKQPYVRHTTGLEALHNRNRISAPEREMGERYGRLWREAAIEGAAMLKSCLADPDGPRGGNSQTLTPYLLAEAVLQAKGELLELDLTLDHPGLISACVVICGKGRHPGEVTKVFRDQEEIINSLRIALQLLVRHEQKVRREAKDRRHAAG